MGNRHSFLQTFALTVALGAVGCAPVLAKQFQLGAEEKNYLDNAPPLQGGAQGGGYASQYGAGTPQMAPVQTYNAGATQIQRAPLQATVSKALPPGFLGTWLVAGGRTKVDAPPEFASAAQNAFAPSTNDTWTISGSPQSGYQIGSSTGAGFQLYVDKVGPGTAFVRYQHPVNNTMAQEAVVLQLGGNGATFSGLERIAIVKQVPGQPPITRCKVQYQLNGTRQR